VAVSFIGGGNHTYKKVGKLVYFNLSLQIKQPIEKNRWETVFNQ
jgi:hypothetical protein